ncbi:MAG: RDD family protein [Acidobacteriota bacterium]
MTSPSGPKDEPGLFDDLPLYDEPDSGSEKRDADSRDVAATTSKSRSEEVSDLFEGSAAKARQAARSAPLPRPKPPEPTRPSQVPLPKAEKKAPRPDTETRPVWKPTVTLGRRIGAGIFDLVIHLLVLTLVGLGLSLLKIRIGPAAIAPLLLFALSFSFLYYVFPLAFWGRTPGMARTDIVTRSRDGQTLSFSQAARRWIGALFTLVTLGVPLLFAGKNGDLPADRLSHSQTFPAK